MYMYRFAPTPKFTEIGVATHPKAHRYILCLERENESGGKGY
jgi:hypothetical protein